ncbi:metallophosphoesterase [Nonomuraea sp. SMC257]|uniref:Metallophosphoesterase n=1 Tax=Nonomuraea montanisoli TaxID=2741721 RepID=A0A7Y6M450_9ACTN|nr:metallophosphoesterase [Nonomuraea montanisoli]NUW34428.1 metallophosphoesterase [Nonomuraea montanisoli]
MIVVAHLSDTHIDGEPRSSLRTLKVAEFLNDLPYDFDAVLVTGDVADHGRADEYEEARKLLDLRHPTFFCPGNHDDRAEFRRVLLGEAPGDGPVNRLHRTPKAVFALCDSTIPGEDGGHLADETLDWLAAALDETPADVPVFVAFHHQPIVLHHPYLDTIGQRAPERLAALVAGRPNVAAILFGHCHAAVASSLGGRPLRSAPGVVNSLRLPWEADLVDPDVPPSLAFHILDDDGTFQTTYRTVP